MKIDNFDLKGIDENINLIKEKKLVLIEKGLPKESLEYLNKKIKDSNIKLILVCDPSKDSSSDLVRNLDVFNYLQTISSLSILVNSSKELNDISNLRKIDDLSSFSISGNYNKKINLDAINKFQSLVEIEFDELDNSNKYKLIESLKLEKLSIDSVDLSKLKQNIQLKFLKINKDLKNHESIDYIFPNLNFLTLLNCKKINNFSFLSKLKNLEFLLLNSTNIEVLPELSTKIIKVQLLASKNLENVNSLLKLNNLEKIAITDSKVNYETIRELAKLKLKNFYYTTKVKENNADFETLALRNGFENSLRGF
ncbi:hypothetical protein V3471_11040 [Flavobacterium oreochromis]|uniref:hypothetical protein n=1 Tax=Flavobacterium oreochromis TaxID=2906078 RepID=UPI00385F8A42